MPVFIDAAGTMIHLRDPVGVSYARIAHRHGVGDGTNAGALEAGFRAAWKTFPPPQHPDGQRSHDDDRSWWKQLVDQAFQRALLLPDTPSVSDELFNDLYDHFAQPDPWAVYPETYQALDLMTQQQSLWVLSNFDQRLRSILEGLNLMKYFDGLVLSSEVGASKPDPRFFNAALAATAAEASSCLHIGDDPRLDVDGARAAGIRCFHVDRPHVTLLDALPLVASMEPS